MPHIDDAPFEGRIGRTYRDSQPHWPQPPAAPPGAPNVVLIVLDDVGFSDLGCYGSEIATPRLDALAAGGVRYSNFHVTSMCSPTRACLISGRNAHAVGVGIIAEWSSGYPSYQGRITRKAGTLPEILREQAYGCYASGKWHLTNLADYGAAGPHEDWPLGRGFARWYGFHGALTDQWNPELYEDNHPIRLDRRPDYHLSTDLTDQAIAHIRDHVSTADSRPFFEYLAYGACHWPHHVPQSYIDRYRGRYDAGWDALREQRLARQKALGIVPMSTGLAPRNPGIAAWHDAPDEMRRASSRLQEVYAAFLEHTDHEIGRLVDYLASIGKLDETIFMVVSDNGASSEGGSMGAFNMRSQLTYHQGNSGDILERADALGSEFAFSHYPASWAQVSNTPFKFYKKDTHGGGVRAPFILHWPKGMQARGEIRTQFHHAIDVLPTILDCAGVHAPESIGGFSQMPIHGVSMRYSFDAPAQPSRRQTQYFELIGNRAIVHQGWKAIAVHAKGDEYENDRWELYRIDQDVAELHDLAETHPEKLAQMIDLWWREAERYNVMPLDDRQHERAELRLSKNPKTHFEYRPGMSRVDRLLAPDISDRNYTIVSRVSGMTPATQGVIFSWGSRFAGFVLYAQDGELVYEYHYTEANGHRMATQLPAGDAEIAVRFARTGRLQGTVSLLVNGVERCTLSLPKTWWIYGLTAGLTCGYAGVPMSAAYQLPYAFTAEIDSVTVDLEIGDAEAAASGLATALAEE